jgi:hypothetical protein
MRAIRLLPWQGYGHVRTAIELLLAWAILLSTNINCSWAQSVSLFSGAVPATLAAVSTRPITLGLKFWSSQPGTISAISFFRGAESPNGYVARLYSADGRTLLGSVTMATESGPVPGWQHAVFAAPISISANTTYVAAYYAPSGQYAYSNYGLIRGVSVGPLNAPSSSLVGGNGVYNYNLAFPKRNYESTNYFVDVVFVPAVPAPYLTLTLNPPNPSITSSAPLGSQVATIAATWSDGSPFTGTLSFGPPYFNDAATFAISSNNLIINPSGPGVSSDGNTLQNVTIVATR